MYSKLLGEQGQCSSESTPLDPPISSGLNFEGNPICGLSLLLVPVLAPLIFLLFTLIFLFPVNQCFQIRYDQVSG